MFTLLAEMTDKRENLWMVHQSTNIEFLKSHAFKFQSSKWYIYENITKDEFRKRWYELDNSKCVWMQSVESIKQYRIKNNAFFPRYEEAGYFTLEIGNTPYIGRGSTIHPPMVLIKPYKQRFYSKSINTSILWKQYYKQVYNKDIKIFETRISFVWEYDTKGIYKDELDKMEISHFYEFPASLSILF